MSDLELEKTLRKGDVKGQVSLIQEWLCLQGHNVRIDSDFGPATEAAVKKFQTTAGLSPTGVVENDTFSQLIAPMTAVLVPIEADGHSLGELTVAYAEQHLSQHPREIGGQNRGPWVRLYMDGHEGVSWAWCAGFTCFCLRQACRTLGESVPIIPSFSCDSLAASARNKRIFLHEPPPSGRDKITPGSFFLVRRTDTDWIHTGIVTQVDKEFMRTVEGNTNDEGSREGYEVCARTRGYKNMDFILI